MAQRVNIGSGSTRTEGWIHADIKHGDIYLDATQKLPFETDSIDAIFHEHFLEHLGYPGEANYFIDESYRVLVPGGVMRIGVPDTEYAIRKYVEDDKSFFDLCRELWHPDYCTTPMESLNFHFRQKGQHKFAYDYKTLHKLLSTNGFTNITRSSYKSSEYSFMNIGTRDDEGTLWVDSIKPK